MHFKIPSNNFMAPTGRIKISTFMVLLTAGGAVYLAVMLFPPWMNYFTFKGVMSEKAKDGSALSNDEILKELKANAKELNIPLEENAVRIHRGDTGMRITAEWHIEVTRIGEYALTLYFSPDVTEQFR
jgi:hypothetical protein